MGRYLLPEIPHFIGPFHSQKHRAVFLKGLCEQCPAKSWMEQGTLDTPVEYLCEVAHAQARYLGLIGESENRRGKLRTGGRRRLIIAVSEERDA